MPPSICKNGGVALLPSFGGNGSVATLFPLENNSNKFYCNKDNNNNADNNNTNVILIDEKYKTVKDYEKYKMYFTLVWIHY